MWFVGELDLVTVARHTLAYFKIGPRKTCACALAAEPNLSSTL